jgi:hypothetical protein
MITLCVPLGYSAVCYLMDESEDTYYYSVKNGDRSKGILTFNSATKTYNWFPDKGKPVLDITDPTKIPY